MGLRSFLFKHKSKPRVSRHQRFTRSFGLEKQALTVNTRGGLAEGGNDRPRGAAS